MPDRQPLSFRAALLLTVVPLVAGAAGLAAVVSHVYDRRVAAAVSDVIPRAEVMDLVREQRAWHLVLFATVLGLAVAVTVLLARRISDPLRRVQRQAHALAAGQAASPVPEEGPAELRALAADFNRMAAAVAARQADLVAANAELARSEAVFRGIFDRTSDLVTLFRVPADGGPLVCEDVNPATLAATGLTRDQVVGATFHGGQIPTEEADWLADRFAECARTGRPVTYERRLVLKTGEHWFHTVVLPLPGPDGRVGRVASVSRDMTEQRKADQALRDYQQRLELHRRHTPLGIIQWDPGFRVLAWNPAAERMFGYKADQAVGRHAGFIIPPEARAQVDRVWAELISQTGGRRSTNRNLTADGRVIECEWYNTPLIDGDGKVIGAASVVQDVTAQRETERALRESEAFLTGVIESATDAILAVDDQGTVLLFNAAAGGLFGLPPEEAFGRPVTGLLPGGLAGATGPRRATGRRADGTEFPAEVAVSSLEAGGRPVSAAIVRDLSGRSAELAPAVVDALTLAGSDLRAALGQADEGRVRAAAEQAAGLIDGLVTRARRDGAG